MSIASDYLRLIETIAERLTIPRVKSVHIGALQDHPEKSSKFGALVLTDGTVGLTYTGLDDTLRELQDVGADVNDGDFVGLFARQVVGGRSADLTCTEY